MLSCVPLQIYHYEKLQIYNTPHVRLGKLTYNSPHIHLALAISFIHKHSTILHYPLTMMVACSFKILVCVALFTLHTHTVSVSAEAEAEAEADQVGIHTDAEAEVIPASFFSKVQNFWWAMEMEGV